MRNHFRVLLVVLSPFTMLLATQKQAASIFGLKNITSIAITATYPGGLVKTLRATAANGRTKTLTKTSNAWTSQLGVPAPWLSSIRRK